MSTSCLGSFPGNEIAAFLDLLETRIPPPLEDWSAVSGRADISTTPMMPRVNDPGVPGERLLSRL
jgi:hypothetical protein